MPDRRQGDRREGGIKKITISLSTFIFVFLIAVIFFGAVLTCVITYKKAYNNGYSQALIDMSQTSDYDTGYINGDSTEGYVSGDVSEN